MHLGPLVSLLCVATACCALPPGVAAQEMPPSPLATSGPMPAPIEPPSQDAIQTAIERGVDFLLDDQRPDGGWGSAENTKGLNIYAPVPGAHDGFKLAVAGLVLQTLCDCEPVLDGERAERTDAAINRGTQWMLANYRKARRSAGDALYNIWGHSYALTGLVALHRRAKDEPELRAKLEEVAQFQADQLVRYEYVGGGWSYYDEWQGFTRMPGGPAFSFATATCLVSLHRAGPLGVEFPAAKADRAIESIKRQRYPDFSYAYGEYLRMAPRYDINRPGGSLGRSQACNLALRLYGDPRVTDGVLRAWLNRMIARIGWLDMGRKKPVPHESYFGVAGYFYYYAHYYAVMCIDQLPAEEHARFHDYLADILLPLQEKDGSWWDYPFYNYHQQYGTAMATYVLRKCQRDAGESP